MTTIVKPREIRITLDPDKGFPTCVFLHYLKYIEDENGDRFDLPPHIENLPADAPMVVAAIGEMASAAMAELLHYQEEVQRLARELNTIRGIR